MWQNQNLDVTPKPPPDKKNARWKGIIAVLQRTYPNAHCELNFSNPLELLERLLYSFYPRNAPIKRVNIVTAELFKKYRSAKGFCRCSDIPHWNRGCSLHRLL